MQNCIHLAGHEDVVGDIVLVKVNLSLPIKWAMLSRLPVTKLSNANHFVPVRQQAVA